MFPGAPRDIVPFGPGVAIAFLAVPASSWDGRAAAEAPAAGGPRGGTDPAAGTPHDADFASVVPDLAAGPAWPAPDRGGFSGSTGSSASGGSGDPAVEGGGSMAGRAMMELSWSLDGYPWLTFETTSPGGPGAGVLSTMANPGPSGDAIANPGANPDGSFFLARSQDPAPLAGVFNEPPPPGSAFPNGGRDRIDSSQPGAMPAAPLNAPSAPLAPGMTASAATGPAAIAASQAYLSPGLQTPPAGGGATNHRSPSLVDPDVASADPQGSTAIGPIPRGDSRLALTARRSTPSSPARPDLDPADVSPDGAAVFPDEAPPSPRGADLIAEVLPLAGESLQRGLEDFVRQLEAVDVAGIVTQGPTPLVAATLAVAGAAASAVVVREVVRRRAVRRGRDGLRIVDPLGRELALSFPELPRSWSQRR